MRFNKFHFIHFLTILSFFYAASLNAQGNYKFEHIDLPTEQLDQKSRCLLEGSNGFMYFGFDNGLVIYDGYKGKKISLVLENRNPRNFPPVASLTEDANGNIWVGTPIGVYIYNPTQETSVYLNDPKINGQSIRSLYTTSKGEILVGTRGGGLLIYDSEGVFLEQYIHQPSIENSLSSNVVRSSYEDQKGNLWIGTHDKLNLIDRKHKRLSHFKLQRRDSLFSSNNLILSIKPLDKKNDSILIVGTETGMCLFNTNSKQLQQ